MADVKWIKLSTGLPDNRKIKQIRRLPDGDTIALMWVFLMCLAGEVNDNGAVYFTEEIPYTDEMLAEQFDMELTTVRLALSTFQKFGMIDIIDNLLCLRSWSEYQNVEGLEKVREQNRIRKQRERSNQKLLAGHVTCHADVTQCHATDKEEDIDKDKEKESSCYCSTREESNDVSRVMTYYMDKINATPSSTSCEELVLYIPLLSADVVIKAMSIALDEHKTSWSYIKAILKNWTAQGVKSLADVQRLQDEREAAKVRCDKSKSPIKSSAARNKPSYQQTAAEYKPPKGRDDAELMRKMLDQNKLASQKAIGEV